LRVNPQSAPLLGKIDSEFRNHFFVIIENMEEFYSEYPTMESFLNICPALKKYILECESYGQQMSNLNIAIVNMRHRLGWKNINTPYSKYIRMELEKDEDLYEIAGIHSEVLLRFLLKCVVKLLCEVTEDALSSITLIDGEKIEVDMERTRLAISRYGEE
jgi:hypothetical protein